MDSKTRPDPVDPELLALVPSLTAAIAELAAAIESGIVRLLDTPAAPHELGECRREEPRAIVSARPEHTVIITADDRLQRGKAKRAAAAAC